MKDSCYDCMERVPRQEANEVYGDKLCGEDMFKEMWEYIMTGPTPSCSPRTSPA